MINNVLPLFMVHSVHAYIGRIYSRAGSLAWTPEETDGWTNSVNTPVVVRSMNGSMLIVDGAGATLWPPSAGANLNELPQNQMPSPPIFWRPF